MFSGVRRQLSLSLFRSAFSAVLAPNMLRYFPNTLEEPPAGYPDPALLSVKIQNYVGNIVQNLKPEPRNVDGGLYVGVSGVAYMFYHLGKAANETEASTSYYLKALDYIKPALSHPSGGKDKTSFLLGDAGNYALAAAVYHKLAKEPKESYLQEFQSLHKPFLDPKYLKCGGDEFFVGRSGYLAGALWLSRELGAQVLPQDTMFKICNVIVESGRHYAKKHKSPCPLMYAYYKTAYLGAAHGISFILQMLLTVPGYLKHNKSASKDVRDSIDFLLSLQTPEGNWPCCMEEVGLPNHKLVHWCHGAPGMVYLMAKAYLVFEDSRYLDSCVKAGELVWKKGLLRKGPGICHGVAGNGYVFLLLYRLTREEKHVSRARAFADFLQSPEFISGGNTPDNPYSLYEGTAGTVCFLADLKEPDKAEFPFQDVFSIYT